MRFVLVSDTHERHRELSVPEGDVLLHGGDGLELGISPADLDGWFGELGFAHVLAVAGNHDFPLEDAERAGETGFRNARLLHDEAAEVDGLWVYGAPWVPDLPVWAYYANEERLREAWAKVPAGVDVLLTHTPPAGILDRNRQGTSLGCPFLAEELKRIRPRLHVFGHVHASAGVHVDGVTLFVNASSTRSTGELHDPVVVDLTANGASVVR